MKLNRLYHQAGPETAFTKACMAKNAHKVTHFPPFPQTLAPLYQGNRIKI